MEKIIKVNSNQCTGCRICEQVCSVKHTGSSNPARSRIHVIKWEWEGFYLPMLCQQCETPACQAACPKEAISRDKELSRMVVNYDLCIGCKLCVAACPFGGMGIDLTEKKVVKCDLCEGEPYCVKFCDAKCLEFVAPDQIMLKKKREAAGKLSEVLRKMTA